MNKFNLILISVLAIALLLAYLLSGPSGPSQPTSQPSTDGLFIR